MKLATSTDALARTSARAQPSPRIGFNHNIAYRGRIYHVQTEDSGRCLGRIFTHVFFDGCVIATSKVEYVPTDADATSAPRIAQLMQESHKAMLIRLCRGGLDDRIELSVIAPPPRERAAAPTTNHPTRIQRLQESINMANVSDSLNKIQTEISGFLGAALVDHESGMCLGAAGNGIDIEVAAAGNTEVVRAKMRVMNELGIRGGVEDMLITLQTQYHIIRPVSSKLFLYLAIDRQQGNLALARHKMASIGGELVV